MDTLFPTGLKFPEGFNYFPDFLTLEEEQHLLDEVSKIPLHTFIFQGFEAKRKVASFGWDYNFERKSIAQGKAIPSVFIPLIKKVENLLPGSPLFTELLLTEYPVGSVINWHRDAPPFGIIAGISLLSDCTFRLRPHDKKKQTRSSIISLPVKHRSLYSMEGAARSEWQHSISPVKQVRFSITLRTLN